MTWRTHPLARPDAPWPYSIGEEEKAVHFAMNKDCPYSNPSNCPRHYEALRNITAYKAWLKHRGVDVDEQLVSR